MTGRALQKNKGKGQALVEFALVLTALALLTIGVLEFGRVFVQYFGMIYVTDHLAQAAARLGGYDDAAFKTVMEGSQLPLLDVSQIKVAVNTAKPDGSPVCSSGKCACQYGEVAVVATAYPTNLRILWIQQDVALTASESLFCWRGGAP
jgi:hypothetical protein